MLIAVIVLSLLLLRSMWKGYYSESLAIQLNGLLVVEKEHRVNADKLIARMLTLLSSLQEVPEKERLTRLAMLITRIKIMVNALEAEAEMLTSALDNFVKTYPKLRHELAGFLEENFDVLRQKAKEAKNATEIMDFLWEILR